MTAAAEGDAQGLVAFALTIAPHKAVMSSSGWAYLINDTNDFLRIFYGVDSWTEEDHQAANAVLGARRTELLKIGIPYAKFIVPEKPVIYPEFLPDVCRTFQRAPRRPAQILAESNKDDVFYLSQFLLSSKSLGFLYFRGDTHPNWLGAWLVYRFIARKLIDLGLLPTAGIHPLREMKTELVSYSGDLIQHLPADVMERFQKRFGHTQPVDGIERVMRISIPTDKRRARRLPTPEEYNRWYGTRETFVYERPDLQGPRVVFFRDSTFDRGVVELLAEHCARSVFIWHRGQVDRDAIEREQPDFVVHCMAERFITLYPRFVPLEHAGRLHKS